MHTQCPECLTVYTVDADTVRHGRGAVCCGHCGAVFDALPTLTEQLPPEPFEQLPAEAAQLQPPTLATPVYRPNPLQETFTFDPDERTRHRERRRAATPHFARSTRRQDASRRWPWVLGTLALCLTLSAQLAYAERDLLLNQPHVRPWFDHACAMLNCRLPLRRDVAGLSLVSRDIRPHPSVPGALIISATVRNDADFAQAFPTMEITLSNLDENRVAMRRFRPRDYVGDARALETGLAPGATAALVVEVQDPGKNAVAFEFKFL